MEPIDKQTIDKLRAYETSYQEGAWEDFEQFRKKKKKRPLIIFWRMAAGIILSLVIGWGVYKINQSDKESVSIKHQSKPTNQADNKQSKNRSNTITKELVAISKNPTESRNQIIKQNINLPAIKENTLSNHKEENSSRIASIAEKDFQPDLLQPHTFNGVLVRPKTHFIPPYPIHEEDADEKKTHPLSYSIALAGLSNQAANTVPQQNFGVRGTTEISLNKRTELSTGIYVGRENLNLLNTTVLMSGPVGIPQLNQVNYRWLNVEVPLNVRYKVWQKGSLAISTQAGISMMGAFNQTSQLFYENRRTVVLVSVGENGQVQEVSTTYIDKEVRNSISNAQRISLGTAINFSLGVHYPLGKNQLSVEPFFKYPLGVFTAEKLHYSSVGVQLRWSISPKKK
ncbi:hypothetical protein [Emticicia sp. C21]|uniref:hypothetical protein n=1 Tax=Emticicia sp. C21 TaxID=2302915 RepID=UPI000E348458|nr:hypothetical protein [Emticicia sp. C21]RFS14986.1 hypothetical protein D0T08_18055 [Emticicia sp. C21]